MRRLIVTSYCDVSVFAHSSQRDEDIACRPPSLSDRVSASLALIQDVRNDLRNAKQLCAVDSLARSAVVSTRKTVQDAPPSSFQKPHNFSVNFLTGRSGLTVV